METVNNIAAAASKALWGEPQETIDAANATVVPETKGTEPVSGSLGDTKKGEPYDKGNLVKKKADGSSYYNIDSTSTDSTIPKTSGNLDPSITASSSGLGAKSLDPSSYTIASPGLNTTTMADTHIDPLSSSNNKNPSESSSFKTTSEKPLISDKINPNLPSATNATADAKAETQWDPEVSTTLPIRSEHETEKTGITDLHNPTPATQANDIRSSETSDHAAPDHAAPEIATPKKEHDTPTSEDVDVSGPGPRTLEEIARENGGVASSDRPTGASRPSSTVNIQGVKTDLKPLGEKIGEEEKEEKGSGDKYIKSSGVVAEGGDFDATRAGAGLEADRLLGRDGKVEKEELGSGGETGSGEARKSLGGSELEEEHGEGKKEGKLTHLKEKIREKLHKH
ncbi:hypothetical protein DSL72_009144 [Monilinia vaccinii-corymbosi]|uniref:Uncharacterized protein n=1 Tax=Monilinia vaccinii-corymbosi TaxID=61207 RepID=A0A8A3PNJ6_9HELO|nr:hypothetical protein DSL72_009144 [Monilinia vaccinii-corymbosi]